MHGHVYTARQVRTMRNWKKEQRGRCKGENAREEKKKSRKKIEVKTGD